MGAGDACSALISANYYTQKRLALRQPLRCCCQQFRLMWRTWTRRYPLTTSSGFSDSAPIEPVLIAVASMANRCEFRGFCLRCLRASSSQKTSVQAQTVEEVWGREALVDKGNTRTKTSSLGCLPAPQNNISSNRIIYIVTGFKTNKLKDYIFARRNNNEFEIHGY